MEVVNLQLRINGKYITLENPKGNSAYNHHPIEDEGYETDAVDIFGNALFDSRWDKGARLAFVDFIEDVSPFNAQAIKEHIGKYDLMKLLSNCLYSVNGSKPVDFLGMIDEVDRRVKEL